MKIRKIFAGMAALSCVFTLAACEFSTGTTTKAKANSTKATTKANATTTVAITTEDLGNYCPVTIGDKTYNIYQKKSPNWSCSFKALFDQYGEQEGWVLYENEIYKNSEKKQKIDMDGNAYYDRSLSSCDSFEWVAADSKCNYVANANFLMDNILNLGYFDEGTDPDTYDYSLLELTDHYFTDNHDDKAEIEEDSWAIAGSSYTSCIITTTPDTDDVWNAFVDLVYDEIVKTSKDGVKDAEGASIDKEDFTGECYYTSKDGIYDIHFELDSAGNLFIEAKLPDAEWIW